MRGKDHYLRANENSETISHCIFVDVETDDVVVDKKYTGYKLRFGWAAACHRAREGYWAKPTWKRFTDFADFWLWAMSHTYAKKKTWVWCHNSSFDYPVLDAFSHLPLIGWKLESAIIDAPPTVVRYSCETKTLVLCDTLNIWRSSLAELGDKVGLPKLELPLEWTDSESDDTYCKRDVEIIHRAVTGWSDWLVKNDMGGFAPTVAAQSMRSFRHRWLDDKILIENNDLSLNIARSCYHGGRCEAFYVGLLKGPIHLLDVNSMYPYVMSFAEMPLRLKGVSKWVQVIHLRRLLETCCVCAYVRLNTIEPFVPIIMEDKLTFPTGRFDCHLCTPEIEYALNRGFIEEVHCCVSYLKGVPFKRFALELYDHKEQAARNGNKVEERHWKLLLNSFYGKWGQSGRKWVKVDTCEPHLFRKWPSIDAQTKKVTIYRDFGGFRYVRSDDAESYESHPAIAAHITAHARMILWTLIRKIPAKHYFYCDTDGLLVDDEGLKVFADGIDQYKLGALKHVKTYEEVRINGCKDLVLDGKKCIKGIREKADQIGENTYRQLRWTSLRGLLAANSLKMPLTTPINKTLRRTYTKGVVGADGFVSPLHVDLPKGGTK